MKRICFVGAVCVTVAAVPLAVRGQETRVVDAPAVPDTVQLKASTPTSTSVARIETAGIDLAPVQTLSDLIRGRAAGVSVLQNSGTTGSGPRIRIRGNRSLFLADPPLLIVDGARVETTGQRLGFDVGGQVPSWFDDFDPEEVESIEVLKGPAVAAQYGMGAANGVIRVTTRRGSPGSAELRAWAEYGQIQRTAAFPANVYAVDATGVPCPFFFEAQGACTPAERFEFNPLEDPETTPFGAGSHQSYGASVSGGGDLGTFFLSGELTGEDGVYSDGENLGAGFDDRDDLQTIRFRANTTVDLGSRLTVGVRAGYMDRGLELPLGDDAPYGLIGMGLTGAPTPLSVETTSGYAAAPAAHYDWMVSQDVNRFTGGITAEFRPLPWLTFNGIAGMDRTRIHDAQRVRAGSSFYSAFGPIYAGGFEETYDLRDRTVTVRASGTAGRDLTRDLRSTTILGTEYLHEVTATAFETGHTELLNKTIGGYVQQTFGWKDRVFLSADLRGDRNDLFDQRLGWIWYPSMSGSWVVSEEPFFPESSTISSFGVRAAFGQAGLRPGASWGLTTAAGVPVLLDPSFEDQELKPERSSEWELGLDAGFLGDRLGLEATYFDQTSTDVLVSRPLPGSIDGTSWLNSGEVRNAGMELVVRARLLDAPNFEWDFSLAGSLIDSEVVSLGQDSQGNPIPPVIFGMGPTQRHTEGRPPGSWFQRPILGFDDADGDGFIGPGEVVVGDEAVFLGSPFPSREAALTSNLALWDWLDLSALLDYRGGYELLDRSGGIRATNSLNAAALYDDVPPARQAAIIALAYEGTWAGFVQEASFVKLRELALTFAIPAAIAGRLGAKGLTLTLAGRDLATWTEYEGMDPEMSFQGASSYGAGEFFTLPPNRTVMVRMEAAF